MTKFPALEVGGAMAESCYMCLTSLLPCSAFTVAGVTSAYVTGPAGILSILITACAVFLAGNVTVKYFNCCCYNENIIAIIVLCYLSCDFLDNRFRLQVSTGID